MTKPKREKYSHLYKLSNQGDITQWKVLKQGNIYIEVQGTGKDDKPEFFLHKIRPFINKLNYAKAWCMEDARFSYIGLFFASKEDAEEYQRLHKEYQDKNAKPKEDKVVKIKHLMEQAYQSLCEAKKLQESFDE